MITYACWKCGRALTGAEEAVGSLVECGGCGACCTVPSASAKPALSGPSNAEGPAQPTQAAGDPVAAWPQPALMPAPDNDPSAAPASQRPPRTKVLVIEAGVRSRFVRFDGNGS
jgi:hypothetical protein